MHACNGRLATSLPSAAAKAPYAAGQAAAFGTSGLTLALLDLRVLGGILEGRLSDMTRHIASLMVAQPGAVSMLRCASSRWLSGTPREACAAERHGRRARGPVQAM